MIMTNEIISVVDTAPSPNQYIYDELNLPEFNDTGENETTFRTTLDPEELPAILEAVRQADIVAIDTETTGLDYMRDLLHGVSLCTNPDRQHEWYIAGRALRPLLRALREITVEQPDKLWLAHNAKFDLHFLAPYNFRPKRIADTMIAQWLVDENMELALKSLAHTRLGYPDNLPEYKDLLKEVKDRINAAVSRKLDATSKKDKEERKRVQTLKRKLADITIYDLPIHKLGEYSARDTRLTFELWRVLEYDLEKEEQTEQFWKTEMPFIYVLLDMERRGMHINQGNLNEIETEFRAEMEKCAAEWNEKSGNVNPNSTIQMRKFLFETLKLPKQGQTKSGELAVDDLTMQRLEPLDKTGAIKALRELKKYEKLMGTYVTMIQERMVDGRLHGSFNQTGTVTGRLSSSDPNLQNIPARSDLGKRIRKQFDAASGYVLVVCDYSQIELRMLANESKEDNFLKAFKEDADPHQMTADLAHVERHVGKTINFSWAYGAGPKKLCDTIEKNGNPRPIQGDAQQWLDSFNRAYPKLVKWKQAVIRRASQLGYVKTIVGRRRRLPDLTSYDKSLRGAAERQCVNARIQGSCADMIKWAMLQLDPWCKFYGAYMLAQVHDELIFECPEDVADEFKGIVQSIMESIQQQFGLLVNVKADPGIGKSWAEAKH